jgi:hypothetical protein
MPAKQRARYQTSREAISPIIFAGATITPTLARESPEYLALKVATRISVLRGAPVVQKEQVLPDTHLYPSLWRDLANLEVLLTFQHGDKDDSNRDPDRDGRGFPVRFLSAPRLGRQPAVSTSSPPGKR